MKTKKWLALLMAGCIGIGGLAGCGSAPAGNTGGESGQTAPEAGAEAEESAGGG